MNRHFNKPVIPEILKKLKRSKTVLAGEVSGDSQCDLGGLYAGVTDGSVVLVCTLWGRDFTERLVNVISVY